MVTYFKFFNSNPAKTLHMRCILTVGAGILSTDAAKYCKLPNRAPVFAQVIRMFGMKTSQDPAPKALLSASVAPFYLCFIAALTLRPLPPTLPCGYMMECAHMCLETCCKSLYQPKF